MRIDGRRIITFITKKENDRYIIQLADTENKVDDGYKTTSIEIVPGNVDRITSLVTNDKYAFVGFGNKYRDNIMLNYVIKNAKTLKSSSVGFITDMMERTLASILEDNDKELEKEYKYVNLFNSFDLQRFLFGKDEMITLEQYVKSSDFKHSDPDHDALNIANILDTNKPRIDARIRIEEIYNEDLFDGHEGVIGARLMKSLYAKKNGLKKNELVSYSQPVRFVSLGNIILPNIEFFTEQNKMNLEDISKQNVDLQANWFRYVPFKNLELNLNTAGLRMNTEPKKLVSDNEGDVYNIDVMSFYPSIACVYGIKPSNVNDTFLDLFREMLTRRLTSKELLDFDFSDAMKLILNGIIGQYMVEGSWLYDPVASMKIRVNGALLMIMLIERLYDDFSIECVTIDGMFVKSRNKEAKNDPKHIVEKWSLDTGLKACIKHYDSVWMLSNNDYITSDMTKKGFFSYKQNNGKKKTPEIVRKAVINNLVDGVPVNQTVTKCNDMGDFMTSISSNETLEWHGDLFKNARYYYSDDNRIAMIMHDSTFNVKTVPVTKSGVTITDTIPDGIQEDLNYQWYISEANKVLEKINTQQLNLFQ